MPGVWTRQFGVSASNHLDDPNFDFANLTSWDTDSPNGADIQWIPVDPSSETSGIADDFSLYLDETAFFEDVLFVDGFETGDTTWWSGTAP